MLALNTLPAGSEIEDSLLTAPTDTHEHSETPHNTKTSRAIQRHPFMEDPPMMWAWIAGIGMWLMEFSYIPQLYRMWKVKDAHGISLLFPVLNVAGRFLAMLYTWQAGELVLATGFLVGWTLRVSFLFQIVYYRWQAYQRQQAEHGPFLGRATAVSHAATPPVTAP